MFEQETSPPWYKSRTLLIAAGVAVILVVGVVVALKVIRSRSVDAHYDELEADRRRQAAEAAAAPAVPVATTAPVAQASPGASPGQTAAAPATSARNYWTNFRGPKRDGNYEEKPVLTSWPSNGLTAIWKQ